MYRDNNTERTNIAENAMQRGGKNSNLVQI